MASYVVIVYGPTTPTGESGDIADENTTDEVLRKLADTMRDPNAPDGWSGVGHVVTLPDPVPAGS